LQQDFFYRIISSTILFIIFFFFWDIFPVVYFDNFKYFAFYSESRHKRLLDKSR